MTKIKLKSRFVNGMINLIVLFVSLSVTFVVAEIGYRGAVFGNQNVAFKRLRLAALYANADSDDDYWKLNYLFGYKPPKPHPILGWSGRRFSPDTYLYNDTSQIQGRQPILLYGDSFAGCAENVACFQDILNHDQEFSKEHYLLNYGVGSYGVDQIFLLFQNSVKLYDPPFVVISFMTLDLDRTILTVRTGQKPSFRIEHDELKLNEIPINPNPIEFFAANPPHIWCYSCRRVIYSYLPEKTTLYLMGEAENIQRKKALNEKIILEIITELRANNVDFLFLIFHPNIPGVTVLDNENDWRDPFIKQLLEKNNVPYIWSKEIFRQDMARHHLTMSDYLLPGDGHPTAYFNQLLAEEIKKVVLRNSK